MPAKGASGGDDGADLEAVTANLGEGVGPGQGGRSGPRTIAVERRGDLSSGFAALHVSAHRGQGGSEGDDELEGDPQGSRPYRRSIRAEGRAVVEAGTPHVSNAVGASSDWTQH